MPVLNTVARLATIISTIYAHILSSFNFCDPGNMLGFAQSPGFAIPYFVSSLTTTQKGMTQFETHMAQVQMATPGSSSTRTISKAICRTKVWLILQGYPVPSLGLPPRYCQPRGMEIYLVREGQQCGEPRRNSILLIIFLITRKLFLCLCPLEKDTILGSSSRHVVQRHLPHYNLGENSVLVCKKS